MTSKYTVWDPFIGGERTLTEREAAQVAASENAQAAHPYHDDGDPLDGIELGLQKAYDARQAANISPDDEGARVMRWFTPDPALVREVAASDDPQAYVDRGLIDRRTLAAAHEQRVVAEQRAEQREAHNARWDEALRAQKAREDREALAYIQRQPTVDERAATDPGEVGDLARAYVAYRERHGSVPPLLGMTRDRDEEERSRQHDKDRDVDVDTTDREPAVDDPAVRKADPVRARADELNDRLMRAYTLENTPASAAGLDGPEYDDLYLDEVWGGARSRDIEDELGEHVRAHPELAADDRFAPYLNDAPEAAALDDAVPDRQADPRTTDAEMRAHEADLPAEDPTRISLNPDDLVAFDPATGGTRSLTAAEAGLLRRVPSTEDYMAQERESAPTPAGVRDRDAETEEHAAVPHDDEEAIRDQELLEAAEEGYPADGDDWIGDRDWMVGGFDRSLTDTEAATIRSVEVDHGYPEHHGGQVLRDAADHHAAGGRFDEADATDRLAERWIGPPQTEQTSWDALLADVQANPPDRTTPTASRATRITERGREIGDDA